MADPAPCPNSDLDTGDDTGVGADRASTTGAPRWVKVFGVIGVILVLLVVIMLLIGGGPGGHGPGRHTGGGVGETAPSGITEHTAPAGRHTSQ